MLIFTDNVPRFLESIDPHAKNWSKENKWKLRYLYEEKDQLKELAGNHIPNLIWHFKSPQCKVVNQSDVRDAPHRLHSNYVSVLADKTANNVIVACKKYHIDTLVKGVMALNIYPKYDCGTVSVCE